MQRKSGKGEQARDSKAERDEWETDIRREKERLIDRQKGGERGKNDFHFTSGLLRF